MCRRPKKIANWDGNNDENSKSSSNFTFIFQSRWCDNSFDFFFASSSIRIGTFDCDGQWIGDSIGIRKVNGSNIVNISAYSSEF